MAQPRYQQIADDLREQIESGALPAGEQIPTELALREKYEASRNTVRDAIKRLAALGLVESRPGQGTFVTTKVIPFVTVLSTDPRLGDGSADPESAAYLDEVGLEHREAWASVPKVEVQAPPEEVSKRMRLPSGTQVVSRHQKRYIDRTPWSMQTSFYPMDFITKGATRLLIAEDIKGGTVRYLQETLGVHQVGYRDWITVRRPDNAEREFFKIAHDAIMFELFRTGFGQDGVPMRVTVTAYPGDRNQFIVNVGDDLPPPQYGPAGDS